MLIVLYVVTGLSSGYSKHSEVCLYIPDCLINVSH